MSTYPLQEHKLWLLNNPLSYAFFLNSLQRFLETAGSVLNYFESFLGRIEIMGSSKTMERVYFEINESNIEQWEKPQIKVCFVLHCNKIRFVSYDNYFLGVKTRILLLYCNRGR